MLLPMLPMFRKACANDEHERVPQRSALYADLGMSHAGKGVLSRFDMHLFCSLPVALLHCVLLPLRCWHVYVIYAHIYIYIITYIYVRINIYTCVYIYIHIYMYVYMHKYRERDRERDVYMYIYVYTCMYTSICIYIYIYMCNACIYTSVCVCAYIYTYVCIYIHLFTYDHTQTFAHTPTLTCLREHEADQVQKERLEELASKEGRVDLYDYCHKLGRSAMEVLRDFPSARYMCRLPLLPPACCLCHVSVAVAGTGV